jgi:hypothetical protein
MTTFAKIGPLEFTQAHEIADPEADEGLMKLIIKCPPEQAKQLIGLCEPTTRSETRSPRIIRSKDSRWGLMPVESPSNMSTVLLNEYTGLIKGYCALSNPLEYFTNLNKSRFSADVEVITTNFNEFLSILYGDGGEDGTDIEHTYEDVTKV